MGSGLGDRSGLCQFPLRKMTGGEQTGGGGKRIIGGAVQNRFWGGVIWYVFPSFELSTPLCFSLKWSAIEVGGPIGERAWPIVA